MKKIVLLGLFLLTAVVLTTLRADDIDNGGGQPLRDTGGRLKNRSLLSLGARYTDSAELTIPRIFAGTTPVADGDVVKMVLTPITTPNSYSSYDSVLVANAVADQCMGFAVIRNGSAVTATQGTQIDVAVAGLVVANCASTTPGVIAAGNFVGPSLTPGQVVAVTPITTPFSTYDTPIVGRAVEANKAGSGKIRIVIKNFGGK